MKYYEGTLEEFCKDKLAHWHWDQIVEHDPVELRGRIALAQSVRMMNRLRASCVWHMNRGHPEILKIWRDKFWRLKNDRRTDS